MPSGLTDRAVAFLRSRCLVATELADHPTSDHGGLATTLHGTVLPILGGDLYGWCCIGAGPPGGWYTPDGTALIRIADHQDAQCALVMAPDGRVGVSWDREFLPRYDQLGHLVEATSMWASLLGWHYVDVVRGEPAQVLDVLGGDAAPEATGEYVRWWLGVDHAVYVEPPLTTSNTSRTAVSVLARTRDIAADTRRTLRSRIDTARPEAFLAATEPVGQGFPEAPSIWGPLARGAPSSHSDPTTR